jgi:hypothetical protein
MPICAKPLRMRWAWFAMCEAVIPAQAAHRHGRTNRRVMTNEHADRGRRQAVHRSLRQEQSPRARCGSGAAWGCRRSCRTPLQSFGPGTGRNARQTLLPEAIEAPRLSRSPRRNARSRLLSGNVSNGSSGRDRRVPRPQTRPRHRGSSPEMSPFSSPRLVGGSHLRPITSTVCQRAGSNSKAEARPAGSSNGPWPSGRCSALSHPLVQAA